jgi:hypothetical protein
LGDVVYLTSAFSFGYDLVAAELEHFILARAGVRIDCIGAISARASDEVIKFTRCLDFVFKDGAVEAARSAERTVDV